MDIVYNLKKFFAEQQDEAAIPGLGVFYKSTVDPNGNELPEGESTILFIEKTPRSNAFVNFLGYEENLTENEAIEVIENWVSSILQDLRTLKAAVIPELGSFEIQKDKVLFFPASGQDSGDEGEYGLENGEPNEPQTEDTPQYSVSNRKPMSKSTLIWLMVIACIVVLTGAGIACYKTIPGFRNFIIDCKEGFNENFNGAKSTPSPILITPPAEPEQPVSSENDVFADEEKPIENQTAPVAKPEPAQQEIAKKPAPAQPAKVAADKPFKVIGGAFSIKSNAEKFYAQMKNKGYVSELFFENSKQLYYVALGSFDNMTQAMEFKDRIRSTKNISCWVYKK